MKTFLDEILADVRTELDTTKARHPLSEIRRMIADAPPVRPWPWLWRKGSVSSVKSRNAHLAWDRCDQKMSPGGHCVPGIADRGSDLGTDK